MTRYYTDTHQWIDVMGKVATVGLTDQGQSLLGSLVLVEVPRSGRRLAKGEASVLVESVKAASELLSPLSGTVIEGNARVESDPALVNDDPEGDGWLFKMTVTDMTELGITVP